MNEVNGVSKPPVSEKILLMCWFRYSGQTPPTQPTVFQ
ncbi:MAG: hypothetical protein UZ14_CFX002003023 [Chloroflexi bacterium OLB14]|nr:MAG: hypothetical protein UZ14_CFX002003023 [Chloroflexi bacterium OLB14]